MADQPDTWWEQVGDRTMDAEELRRAMIEVYEQCSRGGRWSPPIYVQTSLRSARSMVGDEAVDDAIVDINAVYPGVGEACLVMISDGHMSLCVADEDGLPFPVWNDGVVDRGLEIRLLGETEATRFVVIR